MYPKDMLDDTDDGRRLVGLKAIADVLDVDTSTVKRYARRPGLRKGQVVRPILQLKKDHADRVVVGIKYLRSWCLEAERPYHDAAEGRGPNRAA